MPDQVEEVVTPEVVTPDAASEVEEQAKPAAVSESASKEGEQETDEQRQERKLQRKFDKLTSRVYERDLELAELRGRLAAQPATETAKPKVDEDPMPNKDTWTGDYESLIAALARWHARQEHKALTAKEREETVKAEREERERETVETYKERMQEFIENDHEDFYKIVNSAKLAESIAGPVQIAIVEDEHGPDLAYFLGKNPEFCAMLGNMTSSGAVKAIGRLSERLFPEVSEEEEAEETEEKEEADSETVEPPPSTPKLERPKLPAPITPTRKTASTDSGLSDSLPIEDWARRYRKKMGYDK